MPIYDYECPKCGLIPDIWAKIAEITVKCPKCGENMTRLISPVNIIGDLPITGYWDEDCAAGGRYFTSNQEKRAYLADTGQCIKGETPKVSQRYAEMMAEKREKEMASLKR